MASLPQPVWNLELKCACWTASTTGTAGTGGGNGRLGEHDEPYCQLCMAPDRGDLRAATDGSGSHGQGKDQGALRLSSDGAASSPSDSDGSGPPAHEAERDGKRVAVRRCEECGYLCSECVVLHRRLKILVAHGLQDLQAQV